MMMNENKSWRGNAMMNARGRARIQRQRERKGKKSCRSSRGEVICFDRK